MNNIQCHPRLRLWSIAVLFAAVAAGCGGGGDGGGVAGSSTIAGAPAGAIVPGTACTASVGATIPRVLSSSPSSGNLTTPTSTTGVANNGKLITATFSLAMNPLTINSATSGALATFTIKETVAGTNVPGTVLLDTSGLTATFTTSAALRSVTQYTAIITIAATGAGGTGLPLGCVVAWNFTTGLVSASLAPVNLGSVAPFGIASAAGLATAGGFSTVNGNVVLEPTATCNSVNVDNAGGIGTCGTIFPPTINGTVISPFFDPTNSRAGIMAQLRATYLSIAPPGGQGGSLSSATSLGCDVIGTGGGAGAGVGCAGNATLPPGAYIALNSSIGVTGILTLDAGGNADAVFIFQTKTPSTLTTAAGPGASEVRLIGGAKASNVWWQVGASATVGVSSVFNGNILADTSITLNANSTSCGRMLAGAVTTSGAITLGNTTGGTVISVPGNTSAPASCQ